MGETEGSVGNCLWLFNKVLTGETIGVLVAAMGVRYGGDPVVAKVELEFRFVWGGMLFNKAEVQFRFVLKWGIGGGLGAAGGARGGGWVRRGGNGGCKKRVERW